MHEVKEFAHQTDILTLGALHNAFLILPTWLLPVRLSHTSTPLGHKWSCSVSMGIENLPYSLCSYIGSMLVVGIGKLSPKPHFLLIRSNEGVRAYIYPRFQQVVALFQCPLGRHDATVIVGGIING